MDDAALATRAKADGAAAYKAGDYETAIQLFLRAIKLGGEEPHALHANAAACHSALNDHTSALQAAEAALRLSPKYVKGHYRKALALSALGRHADAIEACKLALSSGAEGGAADQVRSLVAKCKEAAASKDAEDGSAVRRVSRFDASAEERRRAREAACWAAAASGEPIPYGGVGGCGSSAGSGTTRVRVASWSCLHAGVATSGRCPARTGGPNANQSQHVNNERSF